MVTVAPKMSVAVAVPKATVLSTALASTVTFAGTFNTGAVVSCTVTFCVAVDTLPLASVAVQVTVVVPSGKPAAGASLVTVTGPNRSFAVAVPSATVLNTPLASTVTSAGTVSDGAVVSFTVTSITSEALLPAQSVADTVTVVVPSA